MSSKATIEMRGKVPPIMWAKILSSKRTLAGRYVYDVEVFSNVPVQNDVFVTNGQQTVQVWTHPTAIVRHVRQFDVSSEFAKCEFYVVPAKV